MLALGKCCFILFGVRFLLELYALRLDTCRIRNVFVYHFVWRVLGVALIRLAVDWRFGGIAVPFGFFVRSVCVVQSVLGLQLVQHVLVEGSWNLRGVCSYTFNVCKS